MTAAKPDAVRGPTPAAKRAQALRESRRRDSRTKRDQVTAALSTMLDAGDQISYASVARRAGVSTWLAYAPVSGSKSTPRSHSKPATTNVKCHRNPATPCGPTRTCTPGDPPSTRRTRRTTPRHLQSTLGQHLTNLTSAPLIERIATLGQELTQTRQANSNLTDEVTALQDDLDASRRALRWMIKNTAVDATRIVTVFDRVPTGKPIGQCRDDPTLAAVGGSKPPRTPPPNLTPRGHG